jgi:hypothetical protein
VIRSVRRGAPSGDIFPNHPLANIKSVGTLLAEQQGRHRYACSYCSSTGTYQIQPCEHYLCDDCADGLSLNDCPKQCRGVVGRKTAPQADLLAESERNWDIRSADERVIVLSRCTQQGLVASFKLGKHDVSSLSSERAQ